jgi:tRNA threonylcarbamoyladenosine biosynthesis protein TsaB
MAPVCLAIETASHQGHLALGRGETVLETAPLPRRRRHNIELMPVLDQLCRRHAIRAADLDHLYVSRGPGSFTGLRISIATVQMLALALNARLVGVPSLEVVAQNVPAGAAHVAVGLNYKRGTLFSQTFQQKDSALDPLNEPALRTLEELLSTAPRPLSLLAEKRPGLPASAQNDHQLTVLPSENAAPGCEALYRLGHTRAMQQDFDDPATLVPIYGREPEAVTLWLQRRQ